MRGVRRVAPLPPAARRHSSRAGGLPDLRKLQELRRKSREARKPATVRGPDEKTHPLGGVRPVPGTLPDGVYRPSVRNPATDRIVSIGRLPRVSDRYDWDPGPEPTEPESAAPPSAPAAATRGTPPREPARWVPQTTSVVEAAPPEHKSGVVAYVQGLVRIARSSLFPSSGGLVVRCPCGHVVRTPKHIPISPRYMPRWLWPAKCRIVRCPNPLYFHSGGNPNGLAFKVGNTWFWADGDPQPIDVDMEKIPVQGAK
eukprot:TRINITY_DN29997_c0_g1_i1.p1 TRINITY_DN29997_c0_g1~~TRINITY_DN29997_c0_g1_i1.p1  ORF type:complete len:271 (+),score=18.91 TRINITY_DN29997_c0_g1_i1:47-814(+)